MVDPVRLIQMIVAGEVATQIKPDGTYEVELKANRTLDCGAGTVGRGTGVKSLSVKGAETVAVELPAASGFCSMTSEVRPTGTMPPGLHNIGGRVRVNFEEYFRGAKTSLLITIRRVILHPPPVREYR